MRAARAVIHGGLQQSSDGRHTANELRVLRDAFGVAGVAELTGLCGKRADTCVGAAEPIDRATNAFAGR